MPSTILVRGANTSVSKALPSVSNITIGFSWDVVHGNGPATEIVACAIVCGQDGKAVTDEHVVFFNQLLDPDEGVLYDESGDLPGGDAEQVEVNVGGIPSNVARIAFVLYVNPDLRRPGTFDSMRNAAVRVLDRSGDEFIRYPIDTTDKELGATSAMLAAELYRRGDEWKFRAVGQGYVGGVRDVARDFGFSL